MIHIYICTVSNSVLFFMFGEKCKKCESTSAVGLVAGSQQLAADSAPEKS